MRKEKRKEGYEQIWEEKQEKDRPLRDEISRQDERR